MTVKRCAADVVQYVEVFQMSALEKYVLEEADVASYINISSSHLCKQEQLLIRSFSFSRHFSS